MTTLPLLIASCRTIASDGALDNFMRAENLNDSEFGFPIDGVNTSFVVKNFPIVPGGIVNVIADNSLLTIAQYTPNEAIGQLNLLVAPMTSLYVSYYFYLFPDSVWLEFVTAALQVCNFSSGYPDVDVPGIGENFLPAVKCYINAYFCGRMAQQTGLWYNQRLQERVEDRDSISGKWLKIAESQTKQAAFLLNQAYLGSGSEFAPAFRVGGFTPRPYTPRR